MKGRRSAVMAPLAGSTTGSGEERDPSRCQYSCFHELRVLVVVVLIVRARIPSAWAVVALCYRDPIKPLIKIPLKGIVTMAEVSLDAHLQVPVPRRPRRRSLLHPRKKASRHLARGVYSH